MTASGTNAKGVTTTAATPAAAAGIASLRDDSLPPLDVPLRFFLTAPWFLVLAGLLWFWQGDVAFAAQWTQPTLASTHLITLGFFTMVMLGALFQVVPVLGGNPIPHTRLVATLTHVALTIGTILLALGLWDAESSTLLLVAGALLLAAFAAFVPAAGTALLRRSAAALRPLRFAGAAFVVTILLGAFLALGTALPNLQLPGREWTNFHAACGGLGWGMLLVIGVGYQVVPMFHVTPPFPPIAARFTVPTIAAGLVLLALPAPLPVTGTIAIATAGIAHCGAAIVLLLQRRRKRPDAAVLAWRWGLSCIAAALFLALLDAVLYEILRPSRWIPTFPLFLGVLFALGGVGTIVFGMLTKIVPFLSFLHLQRRALPSIEATHEIPIMEEILPHRAARAQVVLHLVTTLGALAAVSDPRLGWVAGALLAADGGCCFVLVLVASRRYGRARAAIDRVLATAKPPASATT